MIPLPGLPSRMALPEAVEYCLAGAIHTNRAALVHLIIDAASPRVHCNGTMPDEASFFSDAVSIPQVTPPKAKGPQKDPYPLTLSDIWNNVFTFEDLPAKLRGILHEGNLLKPGPRNTAPSLRILRPFEPLRVPLKALGATIE
jgi:hypothetical protein